MQRFVNTIDIQERLNIRDSFFGGRTENFSQLYEVQEGEKVAYVDYTSLYPFILKHSCYPVGHPEVLLGATIEIDKFSQYYGFAKVKIAPPKGLFMPILPYRTADKLLFALCRKCGENLDVKPCECATA